MTESDFSPISDPSDEAEGVPGFSVFSANIGHGLVECLTGAPQGSMRRWLPTVDTARVKLLLHYAGCARGDLLMGLAHMSIEHDPGRDAVRGMIHVVVTFADALAELEIECMRHLALSGETDGT